LKDEAEAAWQRRPDRGTWAGSSGRRQTQSEAGTGTTSQVQARRVQAAVGTAKHSLANLKQGSESARCISRDRQAGTAGSFRQAAQAQLEQRRQTAGGKASVLGSCNHAEARLKRVQADTIRHRGSLRVRGRLGG
jgi:hypothetical protein